MLKIGIHRIWLVMKFALTISNSLSFFCPVSRSRSLAARSCSCLLGTCKFMKLSFDTAWRRAHRSNRQQLATARDWEDLISAFLMRPFSLEIPRCSLSILHGALLYLTLPLSLFIYMPILLCFLSNTHSLTCWSCWCNPVLICMQRRRTAKRRSRYVKTLS